MLPEALPYHLRIRDHFRQQTSVWAFFSEAPTREEQLSADEREAHRNLFTIENGELEIASRIVSAIVGREDSEPCYLETARLYNLYTRVYGDRCAGEVTGDPAHPEHELRLRALQLWQEQGAAADPAVSRIVEGPRELGRLDLFSQSTLRELTRAFIFEFLRPGWMRTPSMTALAYAYFADLRWEDMEAEAAVADQPGGPEAGRSGGPDANQPGGVTDRNFSAAERQRLTAVLSEAHGSVRDYFAFVMLDFVLADASLEQHAVARARAFAADLNLADSFGHLYNRKSN